MGHMAAWRGTPADGAFSASFILLLKINRSLSMSEKPSGGALRFEECRIAGIAVRSMALWACARWGKGEGGECAGGEIELEMGVRRRAGRMMEGGNASRKLVASLEFSFLSLIPLLALGHN